MMSVAIEVFRLEAATNCRLNAVYLERPLVQNPHLHLKCFHFSQECDLAALRRILSSDTARRTERIGLF